MKAKFVETENVMKFNAALVNMQKRGAEEACLIIVDGLPGLGKTTALRNWACKSDNQSIYLRAKQEWRSSWFLNELLSELGIEPPHRIEKKFEAAVKELAMRLNSSIIQKKSFGLVIDEADHISKRSELMETIRDLSDLIELPVILVGMGKIRDNLVRFPQIASRISQYVRFDNASEEDVSKLIDELCEVKVQADLKRYIFQVTNGFNREIKEAIVNVERYGFRNQPSDEGLKMADMAGQVLVNDRKSGQAIYVPEVN